MTWDPETYPIRDLLRDTLSPQVPQTGPQLFDRVISYYGHVDTRRLWRQLGWLLERQIAVALAPKYRNQAPLEDVGYLRGPGAERQGDSNERAWMELVALGHCPRCFGASTTKQYGRNVCRSCRLEQQRMRRAR